MTMLDSNSKIFFTVFFAAIFLSVAMTWYTIVLKGDYRTYTASDEVPEPTDVYYDIIEYVRGAIS